MQAHQLVGTEARHRVGSTLGVAELNFEHLRRKQSHHSSDLSADQLLFGYVVQEGDYGKHVDFSHRANSPTSW